VVGRRYRLERELSTQGGMGVVWTAIHLVTKRRVAIKLLRASGSEDAASRARLLREARASCAVEHPSILPVLDVIDADGAPALVMELLEGESLRERLARAHGSALGVRETSAILAPVAAALAAAHAARIVHRDIKPENIFLVGAIDARRRGEADREGARLRHRQDRRNRGGDDEPDRVGRDARNALLHGRALLAHDRERGCAGAVHGSELIRARILCLAIGAPVAAGDEARREAIDGRATDLVGAEQERAAAHVADVSLVTGDDGSPVVV